MSSSQPPLDRTDDSVVLVCINCAHLVVFGPGGWMHREGDSSCSSLSIAWPPPVTDDEESTPGHGEISGSTTGEQSDGSANFSAKRDGESESDAA